MLTDQQALQGLWRLVSTVSEGEKLRTVTTHFHFDQNRVKEINSIEVDGGTWATFKLEPNTKPKRLTTTKELTPSRGKKVRRVDRGLYELKGDKLRLCWPNVLGEYPDKISAKEHEVMTFVRDHGPLPQTKQASGKKPIKDAVLGRMTWDDTADWWQGKVTLKPGLRIEVRVEVDGKEPNDTVAITALRELVQWLRRHDGAARKFASEELLETYNDSWNNGKALTARTFANRIKLESIHIDSDGETALYYHAGKLFGGHSILIRVDEDREWSKATIVG